MFAHKVTDEEKKQLIQQLKDKLSPDVKDEYVLSDGNLTNWLEDKKWKVEKAEKKLRACLEWRKNNNIDNILKEEFDESWFPGIYEFIGNDKYGRPVILVYSKYVEISEELCVDLMDKALADKEHMFRHAYHMSEKVGQAIKAAAKISKNPISSFVVVGDMKGVKVTEFTKYITKLLPIALEANKIIEANFPGALHEAILVNAPKKAIRLALATVKPLLKSKNYEKLHVYGRKPVKWQPILLEKIDANLLYKKYGGTKEDPIIAAEQK